MSYELDELDELYKAIAKTERSIGSFKMSPIMDYHAGSIYFYNADEAHGKPTTSKYSVIYASPAWEQFNGAVVMIDKPIEANLVLELYRIDDLDDEFIYNDGDDRVKLILTGNLESDIESYFDAISKLFSIHNIA